MFKSAVSKTPSFHVDVAKDSSYSNIFKEHGKTKNVFCGYTTSLKCNKNLSNIFNLTIPHRYIC